MVRFRRVEEDEYMRHNSFWVQAAHQLYNAFCGQFLHSVYKSKWEMLPEYCINCQIFIRLRFMETAYTKLFVLHVNCINYSSKLQEIDIRHSLFNFLRYVLLNCISI